MKDNKFPFSFFYSFFMNINGSLSPAQAPRQRWAEMEVCLSSFAKRREHPTGTLLKFPVLNIVVLINGYIYILSYS
jgi:hypothetical protein